MEKDRLLAMTDGVAAVIITIMVLELKAPEGADWESLHELWPVFFGYVLSFIYVAIYWNNHHHYFHLVPRVNGAVLWANFHLLFWLSLIPFSTAWLGEHAFEPVPTALYGVSLFMPADHAKGDYSQPGGRFADAGLFGARFQGHRFRGALRHRHCPVLCGALGRADLLCRGHQRVAGA
jgi:hypothetical protein